MTSIETTTLEANGLEFTTLTAGPDDGPVILLLHGFPDGPETFRHQLEALGAAGYRVFAPTLRGYEPSSIPRDGDHSLVSLADDVVGWLDHLGVESAHLVGHDWGATITSTATSRHPERFRTASILAVPPLPRIPAAVRRVPKQLLLSWYMTFFQLRGVAEWSLRARDHALIAWFWKRWSPGYTLDEAGWAERRTRFSEPGVLTASVRYYRQNATPPLLLGFSTNEAMSSTTVAVPTLVLHGGDDGCMDARLFDAAVGIAVDAGDYPAGIRREELAGCGHFLQLEQPDVVTALLVDHIEGAPADPPEDSAG